uniref:IRG-type G domain-containing protein n=1 Tax=Plectus sambesii TaxID=2011161 RepID=A0A914XFL2_9BILA
MINALRHVKKGEPDWAPVSSFQSTANVKPYRFADPSFKYLVLWDMPGCSTGDVPTDSYFFEQKLFAFDFLVIVSDGFPGTAECALAREARRFGVPFAFIQSKCDKELRSLAEENGEESVSEKVKKKFFDEQKLNFNAIVNGDINGAVHFLVSSPVLLNLEKNYEYMLDEDEFKNYVLEVVAARRGLHESTGEHRASKRNCI